MKKTPAECEELDLPEQLTIEVKLQAVKWTISVFFFFHELISHLFSFGTYS